MDGVYLIFPQFTLMYIIEKSVTSVTLIVETWYFDMGMTSVMNLYTLNIKVISGSEIKYDDVIYDIY